MEPIGFRGRLTHMNFSSLRLTAAGGVVVAAAMLAGCGSDEPAGGASSSSSSAASTSSSAATSGSAGSSSSGGDVASLGRTDLTVAVRSGGTGSAVTRTLTCNPAGGSVADTRAACEQLARAGGLQALRNPQKPGMACTQQYAGPAVATVTGTVQGRKVSATLRQNDGCHIAQWNALSSLLGSTAGGN